jgi:hypothetical protein
VKRRIPEGEGPAAVDLQWSHVFAHPSFSSHGIKPTAGESRCSARALALSSVCLIPAPVKKNFRLPDVRRVLKDEGGGMKDETAAVFFHPSSFFLHP